MQQVFRALKFARKGRSGKCSLRGGIFKLYDCFYMKKTLLFFFAYLLVATRLLAQIEKMPPLNEAKDFAVLGTTGVLNTDTTIVYANLGVTAPVLTGFDEFTGPGRVLFKTEIDNEAAERARQSALGAYDFLRQQTPEFTREPKLGNGFTPVGDPEVTNGTVLTPGVYKFTDLNVLLSGTLRLDGLNRTDAVFIFQIEGNFSIEPGSVMTVERGAQPKNVFFQIGGKMLPAEGGIPSGKGALKGNFLVNNNGSAVGEAIQLIKSSSVEGRVLALNGSIRLQDNMIFLPNIVEADLSISKSANNLTVPLGELVTFTITVNNYGPQEANNVRVLENFPSANLEFIDFTFTSNLVPAVNVTFDAASKTFSLGNLPLRAKVVIKIRARAIIAGTRVVNKVTVISDTQDSNPIKDEAEVVIRVPTLAADLQVIKNVNKATAKVGETLRYTVTITNLGPDKATNIKLNDFFPDDYLTMIGLPVATAGTYVGNALFIDAIEADAKVTLTINARIMKEGRIVNVAQISSAGQSDPLTSNNRDDAVTNAGAVPLADLEIVKTANTGSVVLGNNVTYTLIARNLGPATATSVTVTEVLSEDLKFVSAEPADQYDNTTGIWTIGNLAVGAAATLTVTAAPQVTGQVVNSAKISGDQVDLVSPNDSSVATVCVVPSTPVLAAGKRTVCVGDLVAYSVNDIVGITAFQYVLPVGFEKISGSGSTIVVRVTDAAQENSEILVVPLSAEATCANGEPLLLRINVNRPPAAPGAIILPPGLCAGSVQTFSIALVPGADSYNWTLPAGWQILSGQNTNTISVKLGTEPGTVQVLVANGCGAGGTAITEQLTPSPVPAVPVITDQSGACVGLRYAVAAIPGASKYTWTVPEGFTITAGQGTPTISVTVDQPDRKGTVSVTADNASCSSVAASLAADANAAASGLIFPQAFTPNGDDKNETWLVANLLKFPDNDLQIINRWGNEVYRAKSYQNNWRATGLADGTYFYILRVALCDGSNKVYRGYITVMR